MSVKAVLMTGSNMGDREGNLSAALSMLDEAGRVIACSGVYESEPWGEMGDGGGNFMNQAVVLETGLVPEELLNATQDIERRLGRTVKGEGRGPRVYASRMIDIDILFYGDMVVDTGRLVVPHPLMGAREFVLMPLAEILPGMRHPVTGKTVAEMLSELKDKCRV